jgi:hypothetical protein
MPPAAAVGLSTAKHAPSPKIGMICLNKKRSCNDGKQIPQMVNEKLHWRVLCFCA